MRRRNKAGGKAEKKQRPKTLKRRDAPKTARRSNPSAADPYEKIALLEHRLNEALEQQAAASQVLQVISSSPGELEPVFRTMLENATNLCGAQFGSMYLRRGDAFELAATHNTPPDFAEERKRAPYCLDRGK
jgi:hypothetical protein